MMNIKPDIIMRNAYGVIPGLGMQACIKLDIFSRLSESPMDAESLAEVLNSSAEKVAPLLYAMVGAGLLAYENGVFSNTRETETFLVQEEVPYKDYIDFLINKIFKVVSKTAETIARDEPLSRIDWSDFTDAERSKFINGQYSGSLQAGMELGDLVDFSSSKNLLDAAGGSGGLAVGLSTSYPDLEVTIADLPEVVPFTREFVAKAGMMGRIDVVSVDVMEHSPYGRYDTVVIRSFLQVLSPKEAQIALTNIGKAIVSGGKVYIVGHFLDHTRLFPPKSVSHNLVFLGLYEHGRAHIESEYRDWLRSSGFEKIKCEYNTFSDGTGLITASKL